MITIYFLWIVMALINVVTISDCVKRSEEELEGVLTAYTFSIILAPVAFAIILGEVFSYIIYKDK